MTSSSSGPHLAYRPDIDGLRAIAVMAVIGFHAAARFVPGGFVGVDIFFVISGYLISGIILKGLEQDSFSFADFYARRIRRIFPALILVLLATAIGGWFLLLADEYKNLGKNIVAGALFVSNFVLWHESRYFDTAAKFKPLLHLWSLGIEEQFYIVWPLFLFLTRKWKIDALRFIASVAAVSFAFSLIQTGEQAAAAFYLPADRFWELLTGGLLAYAELHKMKPLGRFFLRITPDLRSVLGMVLLVAAIFLLDESTPFPGWAALMPVAGTTLIIAAGPQARINRIVLAHRFPVSVGLISYPLYLWHWPLLSYAYFATNGEPAPSTRFALMALAIFLAWLTYQYVEKISQLQFSNNRRGAVCGLLGMMLAVTFGSAAIWHSNGFAFRYPQFAAFDAFTASDRSMNWRRDKCLLLPDSPEDSTEGFEKNNCDGILNNGKPLILLVGDSHAAALYPGLTAEFSGKANIGQLTSGFCVPMIEDVRQINNKDATPRCAKMNHYVFNKIRELKPAILLVAGNYYAYATEKGWAYPDYLASISDSINGLTQAGAKSIIVAGQALTWTAPLPKIAERLIINKTVIPDRLRDGLDPVALDTDKTLKQSPWSKGVTYISLYDHLCNDQGCLVSVGDTLPDDLIDIDTGHFSESGSRYVMRTIIGPLIADRLK